MVEDKAGTATGFGFKLTALALTSLACADGTASPLVSYLHNHGA